MQQGETKREAARVLKRGGRSEEPARLFLQRSGILVPPGFIISNFRLIKETCNFYILDCREYRPGSGAVNFEAAYPGTAYRSVN